MPICSSCGKEVAPNAKFCSSCGSKQNTASEQCFNCGRVLEAREKFCPSCGSPAKLDKTINTEEPASHTKPPKEKTSAGSGRKRNYKTQTPPVSTPPKKKKGCLGCLFKSLLLLLILSIGSVIAIYYTTDWFESDKLTDTDIPGIVDIEPDDEIYQDEIQGQNENSILLQTKNKLTEQLINTDTSNVVVQVSNALTIILPAGLTDGDEKLEVKELERFSFPFDGRKCEKVFDIALGQLHELDDFVEIQLDPPATFNPSKDAVQCFTQINNNWDQVLTFYDSDIKKIRSFTSHLSMFAYTYETFEIIHDPMMKVAAGSANLWGKLTSSAEQKLLKGYDPTKIMQQQSDDYLAACWNSSLELYGLESAGLAFAENVLDISELGELNNLVGNIGFGLALVNSAMDAQRGKKDKAVLETLKNTWNFMAGKIINTKAINVAFIGVFAIDYALNTFANEAWEGRRNVYRTVFDTFNYQQRTKEKKNLRWWKKQIYWRMEDAKDPSKFEEIVEKLIQEYIQEFWDKDVERAIIQAELQKHGWTYNGGYSNKLKEDLNPEFRIYILQYIQPLIERMQLNYLLSAKELQKQKIKEFGRILNEEHHIRCMVETEKDEDKKEYEGYKVEFKVAANIANMWNGFLSEDAMYDLYCTRAGFIDAGIPPEATLLIPFQGQENKFEKIKATIKLKPASEVTYVKFKFDVDFPFGKWKVTIRPQGNVSGDAKFAKTKSEAESIINKGMSQYIQNPVYAKDVVNFVNFGDDGLMDFPKNGSFTFRKEGKLFILENKGSTYQLNLVVNVTNDSEFIGKLFLYSPDKDGYWVNILDTKGIKIN